MKLHFGYVTPDVLVLAQYDFPYGEKKSRPSSYNYMSSNKCPVGMSTHAIGQKGYISQ